MKTTAANASRLALAGLLIALSGYTAAASAPAAPLDLVLVVDNSGSMKKNDPDFLTRDAVTTLVNSLGQDDRAGLVLFGEAASLEVPLTGQENLSSAFAGVRDKIDFSGKYTNSPAALERAIYELTFHGRPGARKSVIFMTDGIVDTGDADADREKTAWMRNGLTRDARKAGVTIYAIAFSESADFFLIQSLAQQTDGDYYRVLSAADLATTFDRIRQSLQNQPPPDTLFADDSPPTDEITDDLSQDFPLDEPFDTGDQESAAPDVTGAPPAPAVVLEMQTPAEPASGTGARSPWLWGGFALLLVGVTALLLVLRRRRSPVPAATASAVAEPPKALLRDLDQVTDRPEIDIGMGTTVVGRVAGSETRDVNYLIIDDATISRRHAVIQERNLNYWISDAGSTNGTFVNDQRVVGEVQLRHGDQVRFHHFSFEFVLPDLADKDATQVAPRPVTDDALNATVKVDAAALAAAQATTAGESRAAQRPAASPGTTPAGPMETTLDATGDVDHIDLDFGEQDGGTTSASSDGLTETVIVDRGPKSDEMPDASDAPGNQGELEGLGETAVFNADDLRPGATDKPATGDRDKGGDDGDQDDLDATVIRKPED